ncbi:MAG: 2-amino-4-hydroxy-6-hydroxymethyldihydropteridine diphosphokinase [Heliobacteriaceae bacterium]|nr:2-amino-4-hydroxy-6-hydroxymethyldihydropteridine diphosphokinase [Heliobacteriaceae bacterium]MDD4587953.1 2-amino-4-hydroxy-6-hydroxymethyldihydropteridine diphosphokinase [Heliobacteriaceae bacterium]
MNLREAGCPQAPVTSFVGLGSNQGDKVANLTVALSLLAVQPGLTLLDYSSWYLSKPVGYTRQDDFLNGVAAFAVDLPAVGLLRVLLATEERLGRVRGQKWGPRNIDLDLLLYGRAVIKLPELTIPHPLMYERAFVLKPLAEIAPDLVHLDGHTTRQQLSNLMDLADVVLHVPKGSIKIDKKVF